MKNRQDGEPTANDDARKLKIESENTPNNQFLALAPDFGIWNPNIKDAAALVVVEMWVSGEIKDVNEPEDFDGNTHAPWLKAALGDTISTFEARLSSAIDGGRLEASAILRDFDGRLILERTHISYVDLLGWMAEHNLSSGDHIAEWEDTEEKISEFICDDVAFLRAAQMIGEEEFGRISAERFRAKYGSKDKAENLGEAQALLRAKAAEIAELKNQLALSLSEQSARVDRPLQTRQRRTLLTIIAALCSHAGIDHTARGAAKRVMEATLLVGAPVDDDTIRSLLHEIPDALETRMNDAL